MRQNDVTPSYAMTDVILQWQLTSAGARFQNCDFVVSYSIFVALAIKVLCFGINDI